MARVTHGRVWEAGHVPARTGRRFHGGHGERRGASSQPQTQHTNADLTTTERISVHYGWPIWESTDVTGPAHPVGAGSLRLQILGPLRLWHDGVELDAGPRQQAQLLALLLARVGRPVSTRELIDLIWAEDAPASALNIIQKYIGALRRVLEPAVPARAAGTIPAPTRRRVRVQRRTRHARPGHVPGTLRSRPGRPHRACGRAAPFPRRPSRPERAWTSSVEREAHPFAHRDE